VTESAASRAERAARDVVRRHDTSVAAYRTRGAALECNLLL
jgi:hypothetical protein